MKRPYGSEGVGDSGYQKGILIPDCFMEWQMEGRESVPFFLYKLKKER
jgi:hypothetical protein